MDARHRTADVVELMANQYAAHRGFTDERPREGFVKNWTRKLKGSQADDDTALAAMNGINRAVHEGKAKPVPTVIRKPTPDDEGAFVGGRYNDDTQHILIFDQGTTYAGRKVDPIEGRRVTIPDSYDDFMSGIYVHEYGHHRTMSENPEMLARARTIYNSTDQQAIKKHVSLYAASDHKELAAEAHTLRVHPGYDRMPAETRAIVTRILGES